MSNDWNSREIENRIISIVNECCVSKQYVSKQCYVRFEIVLTNGSNTGIKSFRLITKVGYDRAA